MSTAKWQNIAGSKKFFTRSPLICFKFFIKIEKNALLGWKNLILKYVGTKTKNISFIKSTFTTVDLTTNF